MGAFFTVHTDRSSYFYFKSLYARYWFSDILVTLVVTPHSGLAGLIGKWIVSYLGLRTFIWEWVRPANTDPDPLNYQIRAEGTESLSELESLALSSHGKRGVGVLSTFKNTFF